jgi:3-methyladenine DNA glycosylase AlkD
MKEISKSIQDTISSVGRPEKAKWLENYVKHNIKSKGAGIPEIRTIIKTANYNFKLTERKISEQIELLNDLVSQEYTEDKLAAILYLQLFWKGKNERQTIDLISKWFDKGLITDWNVCDWLCVRILTPLLDNWTNQTLIELKRWNKSENLWKARASLVPFAQCKKIDQHKNLIKEFSTELLKRDERFCKTSVGWVLREYSKIDSGFVLKFLSDLENWTTQEVVRNATKYIKK